MADTFSFEEAKTPAPAKAPETFSFEEAKAPAGSPPPGWTKEQLDSIALTGELPPAEQGRANIDMAKGVAAGAAEVPTGIAELLPNTLGGGKAAEATKYLETVGAPFGRTIGYGGASMLPLARGAKLAAEGGGLLRSMAGGAGVNALAGAAAPTGKESYGERLSEKGWDALAGGILGGVLPAGAAGVQKLISPNAAAAPERQALIDVLKREGIDLTAGQELGSKPLMWLESALGDMPLTGHKSSEIATKQAQQFTQAALRRVGSTAPLATQEAIDESFNRIGKVFNDIGKRNTVILDPTFINDIKEAASGYVDLTPTDMRAPVFEGVIRDLVKAAKEYSGAKGGKELTTIPAAPNGISGEAYNNLRSRLGKYAQSSLRKDPQLADALFGIQRALDDALERSASVADSEALRTARRQYRNLIPIAKAAAGPGEMTAQGYLTPSQLRTQVKAQDWRGFSRGKGDLSELSNAAEGVLKPLPNSGTMARSHAADALKMLTEGSLGFGAGGPLGAAAGIAGPALAGRAIMSGPGQAYLKNQAAAQPLTPDMIGALEALIAQIVQPAAQATRPTQP